MVPMIVSFGEYEFYIPRERMPQIDEVKLAEFLEYCASVDVIVERDLCMDPFELRAHQQVDLAKCVDMPDEVLAKPVLLSSDNYVLDGNHRWLGHVIRKTRVPALRLGIEFCHGLDLMFQFPGTYSYGDGREHAETN